VGTRGRGNSGTDLNAIPEAAIDRVEILRDGASAQYGSDAIAGVINIILKKDIKHLNFTIGGSGYYDHKYNTLNLSIPASTIPARNGRKSHQFRD
jgi:iron complex outermembrane receptor protein